MLLQTPGTAQCEKSRPLEGSRKKYKFEQVWYLVERPSAKQVSFLKINQLIVICDPSVVRISVSNHLNDFIILFDSCLKGGGGGGSRPL